MNEDQLRAKALALFHSLVSTWADDLRRDVTGIQEEINRMLDSLQERMAKYEDNLDEAKILEFVSEVGVGRDAEAGEDTLVQVRRAMARLEQGSSLTEVLTHLVQEVAHFAPRVALFVLKGSNCIGWHGQGFDQSPGFSNEALKRISVPSGADTVFRAVASSRRSFRGESNAHKDNVQLLSRLGNVLPSTIFATPVILRDRIAAIVYADSGDSREDLGETEAIEILVSYACKVLDLLSAAKAPGRTTSEFQAEKVEKIREAGPPATPAPSRPSFTPSGPRSMPGVEEESGTVMLNARDIHAQAAASGPSLAGHRAAAPQPATMDEQTAKQHEDAKRFARLLVSEIKLYNEAKVQQGRQNREVYQLLKDDIERSRQLYAERVPSSVRASTNYFNEELVRILADGDPGLLGHPV